MDTQRKYFEQKSTESGYTAIASIYISSILWNRIVKSSAGCKKKWIQKKPMTAAEEKNGERKRSHHLASVPLPMTLMPSRKNVRISRRG